MFIWLIFLLLLIYYIGRKTGYFRDLTSFADELEKNCDNSDQNIENNKHKSRLKKQKKSKNPLDS